MDDKPKTNELQKTFTNNVPHLKKMLGHIKRIFERVMCKNFINEKLMRVYLLGGEFKVGSEYREDTNEGFTIIVDRKSIVICMAIVDVYDIISCEHDYVMFEAFNSNSYNLNIMLQVYNDKIVKTTSVFPRENSTTVKKEIIEENEYVNRIRCIILRKITPIVLRNQSIKIKIRKNAKYQGLKR